MSERPHKDKQGVLLNQVLGGNDLPTDQLQETAWIEVIRKMDEVYSDLIRYEVDLEEKNAKLEEAQKFIASIFESITDVLIVCDQKGLIQRVNRAFLNLTGLKSQEVIAQRLGVLVAEEDVGLFRLWRDRAVIGREGVCEVRFRLSDGNSEPVALHCVPQKDHNGRHVGHIFTGRRVGELREAYQALTKAEANLKQAEEHLIQQEKMASIGRLVAGVAHELNNPISFVYGNMYALERYRKRLAEYLTAIHDGAQQHEVDHLRDVLKIDKIIGDLSPLIDGALEGASRVSDIVNSLRHLSFPNAATEEVNLSEIARNAVNWAVRGRKSDVKIVDNLPQYLRVMGQAGQLHQVLVNLVENALDAMAGIKGPTIELSAKNDKKWIELSLHDSGPGIEADNIDKIFEPFFTTKDVGQGTGLGLWISYDIMRNHGGSLSVHNGKEGGAVFVLKLPSL